MNWAELGVVGASIELKLYEMPKFVGERNEVDKLLQWKMIKFNENVFEGTLWRSCRSLKALIIPE